MRLIDADALLYNDIEDKHGDIWMVVHAPDIDSAPTIESPVVHWISVKDGLPEEKVSVLVAYLGWNDKKVYTDCFARLDDGWKWMLDDEKVLVEITHWMPLPEPPTGN